MFALQQPSTLPEIELYLGEHIMDLWLKLKTPTAPHWAFAWAGGIALARYCLDNPDDTVKDSTVLDIGCGSGLNTVAALKAGAAHVIAVDREERSRDLTEWNINHNGLNTHSHVTDEIPPLDTVDVVLLGDVFYENASLMEPADAALDAGCLVLLGDGDTREYTPKRRCKRLQSYLIPGMQLLEAREQYPAHVYRYLPEGVDDVG